MKLVCQYSVARFLPYVETGEFANFGIVLYCPETGYFGYKLLKRGVTRINAFFEELDPLVFRRTRQTLEDELVRIQMKLTEICADVGKTNNRLMIELTRPREAITRFGEIRAVMAEDPAHEIEKLFDHYVRRTFVTPEYKDRLVEKAVKQILSDAGVGQEYTKETLSGGGYHATFPFVKRDNGVIERVIKPLHLGYGDGTKIFNHAWTWVGRIKRLKQLNVLPNKILVPVKAPTNGNTEAYAQYEAAREQLIGTDAQVVLVDDRRAIAEFARN